MRAVRKPVLLRAIVQAAAATCFVLGAAAAARADSVATSSDGGYARLLFTFTPKTSVTAGLDGGVLTLAFARRTDIGAEALAHNLAPYISAVRPVGDGRTFRLALAQPVRIHTSISSNRLALDLVPKAMAANPPELPAAPPPPTPADPLTQPPVPMRVGSFQNATRLVFDWPHSVTYALQASGGKLTIRFNAAARIDASALTRFAVLRVKNAATRMEGGASIATFDIDEGATVHDSHIGNRIVIDVAPPTADGGATAPPPANAPPATQAGAIAAAAQQLADANHPAAPAPATPATPTNPSAAATPAQASPTATGEVTRGGVALTFPGAASRPSAVFVRGVTAWIVLEGGGPLDVEKLKAGLRDFPTSVEASSAGDLTILRIGLKQPSAIAARADGSNLKVVLGPGADVQTLSIAFARDQNDTKRASLTTLLPGAIEAVSLADPDAGDRIVVVPAAPGPAMLTDHANTEFAVLRTAAGLVVVPYADDLRVAVDRGEVALSRANGLSLTPPAAGPVDSPAALSATGNGPTFLDLVHWGEASGARFVALERRLRSLAAQSAPEEANRARLRLAQFYLANDFAAEALGVLNVMCSADPGLQGDRKLQLMRAAAEYRMGRLHEARNDLAGAALSGDRHAALWRGLVDAALENWEAARAELALAEPVLGRYPVEVQADAHIARAQAGLANDDLGLATASIERLPAATSRSLQVEANIVRARLLAVQDRGHEAAQLFDAVENSGNDRQQAEALYWRIDAATRAGVMTQNAAIAALERLRFRWRGDLLELNTLRKLASLYFQRQRWRDGLRILRVAAASFPTEDTARKAQDDMRAAFASLFLGGKAEKIKPVEALAIFFDFVDLTPIGPDGDEMIRRMADRLVAIDLLGPAADLLNYQIEKRLDGVARASVATKLATIYLIDQKPQKALEVIRATAMTTLPDDLNHRRLLLEARAFAALKQWDNALDLIALDPAPETARLRADIAWESGNWPLAGQQAEQLLGERWHDDKALSGEERELAMRAAIAHSLANDEPGLDRLRAHFAAKMQASPDSSAFAVLSENIDAHGLSFRERAAKIAAVDTLQAFMADFRKEYVSKPIATAATN